MPNLKTDGDGPVINIGINGFGRIGRLVLRRVIHLRENGDLRINVAAINTRGMSPEYIAYLLKHDTTHGILKSSIGYTLDSIIIGNGPSKTEIKISICANPESINWEVYGVEYVCESTGAFLTIDTAGKHINRTCGAKYVVVSAPPKDTSIPMYVVGVNDSEYNNDTIVSNASCTTNCLAPLAKILHEKYGIVEGLVTTVHASTASQAVVDGSARGKKDWRVARASGSNIIPASTGAAKAVGKVIPELEGKLTGMAFRVPINNISVVDLTCRFKHSTESHEALLEFLKLVGESNNVIGYTEEQCVSSDFMGDTRSCTIDLNSCISLNNHFVKIVAWYDNEMGYAARLVDLILVMAEKNSKK